MGATSPHRVAPAAKRRRLEKPVLQPLGWVQRIVMAASRLCCSNSHLGNESKSFAMNESDRDRLRRSGGGFGSGIAVRIGMRHGYFPPKAGKARSMQIE